MHKYVATEQANGAFSLIRDGYPCQCPKNLILLPIQSQMSGQVTGMQPTQFPCNTQCPFASIESKNKTTPGEGMTVVDHGEKDYYVIECEGGKKEIELDELKRSGKQNGLVKTM